MSEYIVIEKDEAIRMIHKYFCEKITELPAVTIDEEEYYEAKSTNLLLEINKELSHVIMSLPTAKYEPTNATVIDASVIKSSAITPNEFLSQLKEIDKQCNNNEETFHIQADDLICELLKSLGYGEGAEYFGNHAKWYS